VTLPARFRAWSVHLLTASGVVWGFLAVLALVDENWPLALGWMALAFFIDSVDGMLARRFQVKEILPGFDGALLDNMVDYFTYTIVPALFLYQAALLPPDYAILGISVMMLVSSYQFAQGDAKSDGEVYFFKGFPSYWNVMVYYFLMLNLGVWFNLGALLVLSVLVFVPIRYVYHTRTLAFRRVTLLLSVVWGAVAVYTTMSYPDHSMLFVYGSLLYAVYYVGISLYLMRRAQ
jgi:phosphatidylcholine synthase